MKQAKNVFQSDLLGESYTKYLHASGLPIYVFPKKMTGTYALFATNFGSVDNALDARGRKRLPDGIAHFLEHKLFTNEDGSDSFEHFSAFGADANAYTSHTRTVYLFSCTDRFADSLRELLTFVTHPYFTPESVAKEQGIIAEEIRMCMDNPYDRCYYNMLAGLYRSHPVRVDVCGTVESISRITDQTLYEAYNTFYQLSNMVLIVCGDVHAEEVFALADECLPRVTPAPLPPRRTYRERPAAHRRLVKSTGQVAKPIFSIGIKDTDIPTDPRERVRKDVGMAILSEMLFSESGELYNRLFDAGLISHEFSADYALTRDFGFLQISGESHDPRAVLRAIQKEIAHLQKSGLSRADFERCRRVEFAEYIKSFDSTEEIANTLLAFVLEDAHYFEWPDIVNSMELSFVEGLLQRCFDPSYYTLSVVEPVEREQEGEAK